MNLMLRAARKQSDKTQAQVAKEANISKAQYQNIEYGKSEPGVLTAIRIADALGVENPKGLFTPHPRPSGEKPKSNSLPKPSVRQHKGGNLP
ncbi:XRE family transcriptional regulator [Pseudoflavonifractor sp. 524-17]|uniref:helix-turn-helix transcriptional regulator n=1 Tax=Pseudoflavonifractor sp. 524-17 TaxID=2304577 RepID=UPI00137AC5A8|nr:helix-turn-helix transcriptional regulator [Pseudoflavonifractor sp. 524-17]NCE63648.1 XRE family transcriptional regulator [Pseudoflavonifractor sp. 524-17]